MNRMKKLILISTLLLLVIGCDLGNMSIDLGGLGGESKPAAGSTMETGIDSPSNGATLKMAPVEISYHATSVDGISGIELSINGDVVSSVASPDSEQQVLAMSYTWNPGVAGSHTIRVRAQGSNGLWSDFSSITVNVEGDKEPPKVEKPEEKPEEKEEPEKEDAPEEEETDEVKIINVKHSPDKFYYGNATCGNKEVTISADVTNPDEVKAMTLFFKFVDLEGEGDSKWDSGRGMAPKSKGHYSITILSEKIPNYNMFEFTQAWYQIVAEGPKGSANERLAKIDVVKDLQLEICP